MEKEEFIKLYDQYAPKVYRFILLKVGSSQDSEDLTSEVFFKLWKKMSEKKKRISHPPALMYRIASNLVTDFYRKKGRRELSIEPKDAIFTNIEEDNSWLKKIESDEDVKEVKKALNELKESYQDIIIWHYLDDFSIKEISQIMEKPENSVRVLLHRALKNLKRSLPKGL